MSDKTSGLKCDDQVCAQRVASNLRHEQSLKAMYLGTQFTDETSDRILVDDWLVHDVLCTLGVQQRVDCLRVATARRRYRCFTCTCMHRKNCRYMVGWGRFNVPLDTV